MMTITEAAVLAVRKTIEAENRPAESCLRVRVKGGGCSGLVYDLSFEEGPTAADRVIEQGGVRVLLDAKSELYLAGTELDYTTGLNGQGFVFRNPDAQGSCGCGKSFAA